MDTVGNTQNKLCWEIDVDRILIQKFNHDTVSFI